MKADFRGYATKAGLKCSDGRTIMSHAFKDQDQATVPLVWQHGHSEVTNVLGHAVLENREDGVYAYGFFNESAPAKHAAGLLKNKDINMMSIWANQLIERSGNVIHGVIREVSLVLSGANPGALIESVTIRHSDGADLVLEDEAIITTGLEVSLSHAEEDSKDEKESEDDEEGADDEDGETMQDIYDAMTEKQKDVVHYMISEIFTDQDEASDEKEDVAKQDSLDDGASTADASADATLIETDEDSIDHTNTKAEDNMTNVFESNDAPSEPTVLSHDDMQGIVKDAARTGSLRDAVEGYALSHGINDIEQLFPDAKVINNVPEFLQRRTEWVSSILNGVRKSPFARTKTLMADITLNDARAKGYVTGSMKKEEFFTVAKRVTTPTTIYKKQKLDRDDMIDITDFNVVSWLKSEMRLMLDEELARAILIGDGRDVSSEDKINEGNIRPIAHDHELYTTTVNVNLDDAGSTYQELVDSLVLNRRHLRGSGQPTMYTTETTIAQMLLLKDTTGRKIYSNLTEVVAELRVADIIPVEVMEEEEDIVCVIVNPADYVLGADKGGQVSMFDDFDIDYNQHKYLIETRCSGALVKLKSAMVVKKVAGTDVLVTPTPPSLDAYAGEVTIVDTEGVVYTDGEDSVITAGGSPYSVESGDTYTVNATPAAGYYFSSNGDDMWRVTAE